MDTATQADGKIYTYWQKMLWPPVHQKSKILDQIFVNHTYIYTNEGYRRYGM
jgi:hypothetical protein